jgi:hypothetical protein
MGKGDPPGGPFPPTTGLGFAGFFFPLLQPVLRMGGQTKVPGKQRCQEPLLCDSLGGKRGILLPGRGTTAARNGVATRRRESPGKKDFLPAIAPKKRHHARNRSEKKTLRQESLRENDVGANNAGTNDTQARGWRGFRRAYYHIREIAVAT